MSTFNPSKIRKEVEEFTPGRPEKFQDLVAAKDVIAELRKKRASHRSIAELLTRHCLPISKSSVAQFCHKVLGEKVRPYRRPSRQPAPVAETETAVQVETSPVPAPPTEASPSPGSAGDAPPATRPHGPRIAQIRMLKPQSQTT